MRYIYYMKGEVNLPRRTKGTKMRVGESKKGGKVPRAEYAYHILYAQMKA